jgi:hypothetical protein
VYIDYDDYVHLYDPIDQKEFTRLLFEAERIADKYTTGIDGFCKLQKAMPVDDNDREAVKHCIARIVYLLHSINRVQQFGGYEETEHGARGRVISSISSGNESISYSAGTVTAIEKAASDFSVRRGLMAQIVRDYLSGVHDSNGVGLLYMGPYPGGRVC